MAPKHTAEVLCSVPYGKKYVCVLHKLHSGAHGCEFKVNESTIYMPDNSVIKNSPVNVGDLGLIPGSGKIPWRRKWQPTPLSLLGKSHGQRILVSYSPQGLKQSDTAEQLTVSDL